MEHYAFIISVLKNGVDCEPSIAKLVQHNVESTEEARELCGNDVGYKILSLWKELDLCQYQSGNTQPYWQ
jgi:hypothetical protein